MLEGARFCSIASSISVMTARCGPWSKAIGSAPPPPDCTEPTISGGAFHAIDRELQRFEHGRTARSRDFDPFRIARPRHGGRIEHADGAALETDRRRGDVFGVDRAQRRGSRQIRRRPCAVPARCSSRSMRMDGLAQQHAAAVARAHAAPRLSEIGIVAPPADRRAGRQDLAEFAGLEQGFQVQRCGAEAVLQDNAADSRRRLPPPRPALRRARRKTQPASRPGCVSRPSATASATARCVPGGVRIKTRSRPDAASRSCCRSNTGALPLPGESEPPLRRRRKSADDFDAARRFQFAQRGDVRLHRHPQVRSDRHQGARFLLTAATVDLAVGAIASEFGRIDSRTRMDCKRRAAASRRQTSTLHRLAITRCAP